MPLFAVPIQLDIASTTNAKEGTPIVHGVYTITLDAPAPLGGLVVSYTLAGSATSPANYSLATGLNTSAITSTTFTIDAGATTATIEVVPINDFLVNSTTNNIIMTIAPNLPDYQIGTTGTATINILDDDNLFTVTSTGTANEGGTTGTFTFSRATSTVGAIVVNFSVGGTAIFPTNYTVSGATSYTAGTGSITIPAGQASATLTIQPINDFTINPTRGVTLAIVASGVPNYTIASTNNNATLNITDFVITQVATISAGANAAEGTPSVNGNFVITLSEPAKAGGLVVQYATAGSALFGTHYTIVAGANVSAVTASTFTINAGAGMAGNEAIITIVPINDYSSNASRNVITSLSATGAYNFGGTGSANITITDDSNKFKILSAGSPNEDGTTGTFTITRTNTVGAVVINFTVGGTATYPTHYSVSSPNPLTFSAGSGTAVMTSGQSSVTITITPINDQIINTARTVVLTLGAGTPPEYTIATAPDNEATLTIADGTAPMISLTSLGTPTEGSSNGAFTFTRTGATSLALSVDFTLTGTAIANTNYTVNGAVFVSGNTWRMSILAGQTSRNIGIVPINDFVTNASRTVIATTINTAPATYSIATAPNDTRTLFILDDANPITISSSGSVTGGNTGTYTFTRVNTSGNLFVYFNSSVVSGTPLYTVSSTNTFAFNPGVGGFIVIPAGATTAVLNIDAAAATTTGSINITLTPAPTPNYTIGTTAPELMNILSVGSFVVTMTATSPVTEGGTSTINFTRTGFFAFAVTVNFSVSTNGFVSYSVTGANTFSGNSGTVIINGGGGSNTVSVNLNTNEDNIANGTRSIDVFITGATFGVATITPFPVGTPNTANIVVNDSNRQIAISAGTNANENGTTSAFTFTRTGSTASGQLINFSLSGTATYLTDYTLSGASVSITGSTGSVIIPAGFSNIALTLTPINDLLVNTARTAIISITSGTPLIAVAIAPNNTGTITIDDDPNIISVSVAASPLAAEAGPTSGKFIIKRNTATTSAATIAFSIDASSTALFPTHYTISSATTGALLTFSYPNGTINIPAGASEVDITVNPINDFMANPNRTLVLKLVDSPTTLPRPYRLSGTLATTATITILDDANTISITKIGADATKSGSVIGKFRISRTNFIGLADLTVNFNITGTATLNTHYVQSGANFTTGKVTIPANTQTVDIDITAINDWAINSTKNIILTLTTGSYIVDATNNSASMNIVDDNNFVDIVTAGSAYEAGATGTALGTTFTISRSNGSNSNPLPVTFSIAGSATILSNYTLTATGGITYNSGNTQGTVTIPTGASAIVLTLMPINDNQTNNDRNVIFTIAQRTPQNYTIINTSANSATATIVDDKNTISISSAGSGYEAGATGSPLATTFTISRTNPIAGNSLPLAVTFNIGGSATILTHYTLSANVTLTSTQGKVTIPAGANSVVVTLTPINDNQINNNRDAIFAIAQTSPQTYLTAAPSMPPAPPTDAVFITIIDDKNTVSITAAGNAFEAGAGGMSIPTTFTFSRTNSIAGNARALPISFSIGGVAILNTHYTLSALGGITFSGTQATVTIPAGASSVDVILTPINDGQINTNRDVSFTIVQTSPQSYLTAMTNSASITIIDDNNMVAVTGGANAMEADVTTGLPVATTFTFSRTGGSTAIPLTISFSLSGTATLTTHYTFSSNVTVIGSQATVTIPAGASNVIVTLTPINDLIINTNRIVTATITQTATQTYTISATASTASITIVDDNNTVSVTSSGINALEADLVTGLPVTTIFTFSRTGGSIALPLNINFTIAGAAIANTHYTLSATGGVTFNASNTQGTITIPANASNLVVTLTPINDFIINSNRDVIFTVAATTTPTYTVITPIGSSATAIIVDDKNTVLITASSNAFEADVTTGLPVPTTFTFSRTGGSIALPLTVNFTIGGAATALTHYTLSVPVGTITYNATQGTVTIPANQSNIVVILTPINDNQINNNRDVVFTIAQANPQTYLIAAAPTNSATITIIDDKNTVSIGSSLVDAFEAGADGNPVATTFVFSRTGASNALPLSVLFAIAGTATANTDYTLSAIGGVVLNSTNTEGTVTIPAGSSSVIVTLTPINDYVLTGDRTVIFTVSPKSPPSYLISSTNISTKNIIDDTNEIIVFSGGSPSEIPTTGTFTFFRHIATTAPVTVHFTVGGTATFSTHYTVTSTDVFTYSAGSGTIVIPANATSATITINPINDFIINTPRTVILTVIHTTPNKSYVVGLAPNNQASLAILDDNNAVTITKTGTATEDGSTAKFTISKPNPTNTDITISFNVNTMAANSAIFNTNYTVLGAATFSGTSGTVVLPMNQTSVDITIVPIDDNLINIDRSVTLDLINPMPFQYQLSGTATEITSTIIIKNDDPQATVSLGTNPNETNTVAGKFTINFNAAPTANTTINYVLTGTAAASRYTISGGANIIGTPTASTAVVAAGSTSAEIIFTPVDDFIINPNETIILTLQASTTTPTPDYFVGLTPTATMQIIDNDVNVDCAITPTLPTATWTGIQNANLNYTASTGQALEFAITTMNLGNDTIKIYNGTTISVANLIAEYTGNTINPPRFTSIAETMTVVVHNTNASANVVYNVICIPQTPRVNCGAANPTLYNIGTLTTPYPSNSRIFKTFQSSSFANGNGQISATFIRFDVEASYDVVKVFDSADTLDIHLIGTFHNGQLPTSTLTSSNAGGYMTFLLYADGNVERSGFEVSMTCGANTVSPTLSNPDLLALEELKTAYPSLATLWNASTPTTWAGVVWNQEPVRRVTSITASGEGLVGALPPKFAFDATANDDRMSRLQSLDLSNNGIDGIIPASYGKLKVTHLNLSNNSIDDVAEEISDIANLVTLNLSSNSLKSTNNLLGLENLQYLTDLDLSNNLINEYLPVELLAIPNLTNLNLSVNQFTGTLPEEIKDMEYIKVLNLSSNNLTGTLNYNGTVLLFDDQRLLEKLDLSNNEFTGALPSNMINSIKFLNLSENKLTGSIDNITQLPGLIDLELQKNDFSGVLPLNLQNISFAVNINLSNNKFTGTIPSWTQFNVIRTLNLSFNKLSGQVPASLNTITSLTNLFLNDNQLVDLPILTDLINMKNLAVYNNRLTFEDLEPNITVPNFTPALYAPQATINDTIRITTTIGATIRMRTNTAGTANFYRWRKGNLAIGNAAIANDSLYIIGAVSIDNAGVYTCDVTSTKVVGLTLIRNPIILNVGNPRVNVSDSLALVALYRSADGKNWENTWNLTQPVRTWYGVTLEVDRVVILRLNDNKLDGKITDSLRLLTKLQELNLRKNKLGDSIPIQLGELQNLTRFDLSGNRLLGAIPVTIGSLNKLTYLDLSENLLTGAIPSTFSNLNKLVTLSLNDNNLTGMPILTGISTLKTLKIENNRMQFGDLEPNQNLISNVSLKFSYSPQALINEARTIQAVFATSLTLNTQTTGSANSYQWTKSGNNIGANTQVADFKINSLSYADSGAYSCKITNSLIPNLTLIRRTLTVVVNQPTLLRTDSLALVDLYNSTNGANWDKKWILTQPMDTWFGVVLDKSIGRVIRVLLSNNKLNGTISTSIGNLSKLKELNIRANPDLTGTIPSSIGNLLELEDLNLRGNKLSGTIPTSLGNLSNLKTMAVDNNLLTGVIPTELGNLKKLSVLYLNNNKFTGILPSEINNLTLLQELYLNDNELDKLPNLPNLTVLGTLDVKNNKLGFESLESLIRIASFQYSPQMAKDTVAITVATGQTMALNTQAGGTQNLYQWRTNATTAISNATTAILTISNIQPQSTGAYTCSIKNSLLPNLTITYLYAVKVVPAVPQITQPLAYCIGNSSITLTAQGTQAAFTRWTWYNGTKVEINNNRNTFSFTPKQAIDTVFAVTVVKDVESSAKAMLIIYVKPILQNNNGVFTVLDNGNATNKYQWFYFESPISGATNKTFSPEANKFGDYKVNVITEEGCASSSDTYKFANSVTGTEDEMLKNSLKIYPNPATENLQLVLDNTYFGATTVSITDVLGRILWETKLDKNSSILTQEINVSSWASGTYCLRLQSKNGFASKKFVKN